MANIRPLPQITRIAKELRQVSEHVRLYSGIDPKLAAGIDAELTDIMQTAAILLQQCRRPTQPTLLSRIRKVLGYT